VLNYELRPSPSGWVFGTGPSSPSASRSLRDLHFFELRITPISCGLGKNYELRMGYLERELIVHLKRELPRGLAFFSLRGFQKWNRF
jgi:hypothetical protein